MAPETVELVKRWFEGLSRGDLMTEICHPEIEVSNWDESPVPGSYHGHDGLRRWWKEFAEAFADVHMELKEVIDIGDGRVVTAQHLVGVFRNTGIPLDAPFGSIVTVRDGLIASAHGYASPGRAKKAAGLRPLD